MKNNSLSITLAALALIGAGQIMAQDSLPPLDGRPAPTNLTEMWQGFDPLRDPLETEIVREWQEADATFRYVVFTIGTFKGQKSRVAAFYGFPKSDKKLPGIVQLHGGGQRASTSSVRVAAKQGYACVSVNWGGREMEGAKPGDKNTDYHAINLGFSAYNFDKAKTLDPAGSPRNSGWFMATVVARRAITFLQQQPEVDPQNIGAYGHSMGGKITTDLAGIDPRIKAAVPSCGSSGTIAYQGKIWNIPNSIGKMKKGVTLEDQTVETQAYLPTLTCPILNLNPTNDYNSPLDVVTENWEKIGSKEVYQSNAVHRCHLHNPENEVCTWLWFAQWLQHAFKMPKNPAITVDFKSDNGVPRVIVKPDASIKIQAVDIYYSTEPHIITRFWRDGEAKAMGVTYQANCPILDLTKPFYTFANITYALDDPMRSKLGADRFQITSKELIILPGDLVKAGAKATDQATRVIEDFARGWHDWYGNWDQTGGKMTSYKIKDPKWRATDGDRFCLEVKSSKATKVDLIFSYNRWNCFMGGNEPKAKPGSYKVSTELKGSPDWQTVSVGVKDLQADSKGVAASPVGNWQYIADVTVSAKVDGIRKIYWAKGTETPGPVKPDHPPRVNQTAKSQTDDLPELSGQSEEFKDAVRKSLEEEKKQEEAKGK